MLPGAPSAFGLGWDLFVVGFATVILIGVTARMYPRLARERAFFRGRAAFPASRPSSGDGRRLGPAA